MSGPTARLLLSVLLLLAVSVANADERILNFHSDIRVFEDGAMEVAETIRVRAEGNKIRRGIYRDFPTTYRDSLGNRYRVGFELLGVLRDGATEDHHTERIADGVRIYAGSSDHFLSAGEYTYVFRYRTDRQLGFFADHDELYWNVTGNGWDFFIDEASATVMLPSRIPGSEMLIEGYTGFAGKQGRDYEAQIGADGAAHIRTTRKLNPREGITLVVSWPKGYIAEPTRWERAGHVLADNSNLIVAVIGLFLLLLYYLVVWDEVGRDPEPGIVIPHYVPPAGYSPASTRFISRMGYDHSTFATAVLNLAVHGLVEIDKEGGDYTLRRTDKPATDLAPGERTLLRRLLGTRKSIELDNENHATISGAIDAHKRSLRNDYRKIYFVNNRGWLLPGVLISILVIGATFALSPTGSGPEAVFMTVWLFFWTLVVIMLFTVVRRAWRHVGSAGGFIKAVLATMFLVPFLVGHGLGSVVLSQVTSVPMVAVVIAAVAINVVFFFLMRAPTRAGRKLMDKLEGFKLYLEVAEKDELNLKNPPEKTPELFERYLPFALALGVEQAWAEKFASVFERFRREQGRDYHPHWYRGRWDSSGIGRFTSSFGSSLSGAIAASSQAPGSSSGGGGGGGGW